MSEGLSEERLVEKIMMKDMLPVIQEVIDSGGKFHIFPSGTSMLPMLRQKIDSVDLIKAEGRLKKYDLPLYRRNDGSFVLHRIVEVKKDSYTMCGDNQLLKEKGITDGQIIGVVDGFYRGEKYISCWAFSYRLYVHLWSDSFIVRKVLLHIRSMLIRLKQKIKDRFFS